MPGPPRITAESPSLERVSTGGRRSGGGNGARRRGAGWKAAFIGGVGSVWGLGLARLLAEAALWPLFYTSPLAVGAVAVSCAAVAVGLWRWSAGAHRSSSDLPWSSFVPLILPLLYVVGATSHALAGGALLAGGVGLTLLLAWQGRPSWVLPALLGLVVLALYLRTLLPSVGEADTFEFQVVVPQLGVAHPTGYPLYVLLGRLFALLPLGNVAWRLNLGSAVFGVAAVVVLYGTIRWLAEREERRSAVHRRPILRDLIPFLAALAFALSPTFWSQAVVAEVYTLHNLLVAVILWLVLRQADASGPRDAGWVRRWYGIFFLLGLSLTNHLTTALLVPVALVALLTSPGFRPLGFLWGSSGGGRAVGRSESKQDAGPDETPKGLGRMFGVREGLIAAGLFLLGLSVYLFIPLRWPALHDGAWMTPGAFLRYVTGGQFHGALRLDGWRDPTRWRIVGRLMEQPFGWAGLGLAVVGVIRLAARRWRALALTGMTFLAFFVYGLLYYVADVAVFLLPAHLILAIWIGVGAGALARLPGGASVPFASGWRPALVALFALLPLSQLWTHLPAVDRSDDRGRYAWGRYALRQPLDEGGAVLADPKRFAPLYYLQQIEGVRPDLDMVLLGSEELYQEELRRRLAEGQTVYLARYLPHLGDLYLRSVGPLVEAGQGPDAWSAPGEGLARLGERIELLDAEVEKDPLGRTLYHVTLDWQVEASVDRDLVVRLRLVDGEGGGGWTSEGARPVGGLYPTNAWPPGAPISDYHEVAIPPWLPPGAYELQVGLFAPFGDEGLAVDGTSTPWVSLGAVDVELPSQPQPLPRGRLLHLGDEIWLTGLDVPREAAAGGSVMLDLAWRGVAEEERVRLRWGDGEGASVEAGAGETFPVPAGMVRSRQTVSAPDETGPHTLYVGLEGERARCGWLAAPRRGCPLADVRIVAGGEGLATFGDRVLLLEAEVGRDEARPGDVVPVTLRWRGLRSMDVDYTVFVHLVGPDGRLHGQVDSWPVQGSYPTSEWTAGEALLDRYEVRLEPDAPAGAYRVEVGLYELETMERLRVLGAGGEAIGDSFVVGTLEVLE